MIIALNYTFVKCGMGVNCVGIINGKKEACAPLLLI
nr:MAG TPA: hypothetical protein [Caudoviricetes sp.]